MQSFLIVRCDSRICFNVFCEQRIFTVFSSRQSSLDILARLSSYKYIKYISSDTRCSNFSLWSYFNETIVDVSWYNIISEILSCEHISHKWFYMCVLNIGIVEGLKYLCVSVQILKVYANFMKHRLFVTVYSLSRNVFQLLIDMQRMFKYLQTINSSVEWTSA